MLRLFMCLPAAVHAAATVVCAWAAYDAFYIFDFNGVVLLLALSALFASGAVACGLVVVGSSK